MIKTIVLIALLAAIMAVNATNQCGANISGPNQATPGRRAKRTSASCSANISGPNNASPAKRLSKLLRQSTVCSGNGVCDGDTCVCNAGFEGDECEVACIESTQAPTTAAPTVAPTTAAPSTAAPEPPVNETPAPTSPSCVAANISGPNNASPAKRTTVCSGNGECNGNVCVCANGYTGAECETAPTTPAPTSASCVAANISGPNNASPAKRTTVCSGNGNCNGNVCVCSPGFSGAECENAPSTAAPTVAPSTAAPTVAPTVAPTTAAPSTPAPTSGSCVNSNISGPNNASPAKRQTAVCSGNGSCSEAQTCVCNAGWTGSECDVQATAAPTPGPTENISGENNARASSATTVALSGAALVVAAIALL